MPVSPNKIAKSATHMPTRQWIITFGVLVLGQTGGVFFGLQFKEALLIALLAAWAAFAIIIQWEERRFIAKYEAETSDYRAFVRKALDIDAKPFLHKVNGSFAYDWRWAAINIFSAALMIAGFPVMYTLVSGLPLSWDAPFSGGHLLAMLTGFGAWALIRRFRARSYRCPACATHLAPIHHHKLYFECSSCNKLWYVLDQHKWV